MAERTIVRARVGLQVGTRSGPHTVKVGDLYNSDDPLVKSHPTAFEALTVRDSRALRPSVQAGNTAGAVETASAGPGEARTLTAPPPAPPVTAGRGKRTGEV